MDHSNEHPSVLISRARAGDEDALSQLLSMYGNYLQILARTQVNAVLQLRIAPSDLVQETLLEACQNFGGFEGQSERELLSWLRKILVRTVTDQARRHQAQKRDVRRQRSLHDLLERSSLSVERALAADITSPSQRASNREQAVILADALARLPDDYREVIILRHLQGLKFEDVAGRMGRSSGAVRMMWPRALEQLRRELEAKP